MQIEAAVLHRKHCEECISYTTMNTFGALESHALPEHLQALSKRTRGQQR